MEYSIDIVLIPDNFAQNPTRVINKNIADDNHKIEVMWYNVLIIQQNIIYIPIGL